MKAQERLSPSQRGWMLLKPWLTLGLAVALCAHSVWWLPVVIPLHFVTVVSTLHDAVHGNLGLGRRGRQWALFVYGALMLQSGHSFRRTHLFHHRHFPSHDDLEGHAAFGTVFEALCQGPTYLARLWLWTWRKYPRDRGWLLAEAVHQLLWLILSFATLDVGLPMLAPAFVVAAWGLPLATARLQHDGTGTTVHDQTRTIHHPVWAWLLQGLGYHREHHMNPRVPALKLRSFVRGTV